MRMDSSPAAVLSSDSYSRNAKVPVVREGKLNGAAVRQISSGSIVGTLSRFDHMGRIERISK